MSKGGYQILDIFPDNFDAGNDYTDSFFKVSGIWDKVINGKGKPYLLKMNETLLENLYLYGGYNTYGCEANFLTPTSVIVQNSSVQIDELTDDEKVVFVIVQRECGYVTTPEQGSYIGLVISITLNDFVRIQKIIYE